MNIRYPIYEGVYRILTKKYGSNSHAGHCTGTETAGTQPGSHQQGTANDRRQAGGCHGHHQPSAQ